MLGIHSLFEPSFFSFFISPVQVTYANRAHMYAGAVRADEFHINAFVYNNEQSFEWQNNDQVSIWSAECTELLPSFTSRARWAPGGALPPSASPVPNVTVATGISLRTSAPISVVARAFTEAVPNGLAAGYQCHHIIVVNPSAEPIAATVAVTGFGLAAGTRATRLFNGRSSINLTAGTAVGVNSGMDGDVALELHDFVDAQTANVYRIGCDTASYVLKTNRTNYCASGGFESDTVVVQTPGRALTAPGPSGSMWRCDDLNILDAGAA